TPTIGGPIASNISRTSSLDQSPAWTISSAAASSSRHCCGSARRPFGMWVSAMTAINRAGSARELLLEVVDHLGIAEGYADAELPAVRDVAEQPPHDLPRAGLREVVGEGHLLRARQLADLLGDVIAELGLERVVGGRAAHPPRGGQDRLTGCPRGG